MIEGADASLKLGLLAQPAYEYLDRTVYADDAYQSFFLRRARFLALLTLGSQFEVFAETETSNIGRAAVAGGGVGPSVALTMQDIFATWRPAPGFKIDAGLLLVPFSHNSLQGASTLLGLDYFAFSFQQGAAMQNYNGRDTGVEARGLIAEHLEYRVGAFTGRRATPAAPPTAGLPALPRPSQTVLRFAARLQVNLFDAESAFFYGGTYAGNKRILSFGAGYDMQASYKAYAFDLFFDWPVAGLGDAPDVITVQANLLHHNGNTWTFVPRQTDFMAEIGYRIGALGISPIFRYELASLDRPFVANPDQKRLSGGLAWWYLGHNANLKVFYTWIRPHTGVPGATHSAHQLSAQMQLFVF